MNRSKSHFSMNEAEKRRRFFYAMNEAGLYDATIEWVAPFYREMHAMLLKLVDLHIQRRKGATEEAPYPRLSS